MIYELNDDEENWLQGVADMRMVKESPTSSAVHVDTVMGNEGGSPRKRKRKKPDLNDVELVKQAIDKIIQIKIEMRKASFASRSEAGRYAAEQRWKGHLKDSKTVLDGGSETKYSDGMSNGMTDQEKQLHELAVKTDTEIARLQDIGFNLSMSRQRILESITKDYKSEGLREKNEGESVFRYNDYLKQERADQLKVLQRNLRNPLTNAEAVAKLIANFKAQPVRPNGSIPDVEYMISQMNDGLGKLAEVGQQIDANNALLAPLNKVFAENGWSRFFLVTNTNGHIHKSMDCSTTFPTTEFAWITNLSGLKEKDAVAQEGEILCTHCFPSAPSEWTSGESRPKRIAREARAQEKKIRDEKKLAKLLTPNGEDLILRGDSYEEKDRQTGLMIPKVKTERLSTVHGGKEFLRDYHDFVLAARKTTEPKRKAWMTNGTDGLHTKENADLVASMVAQKTGKTVEEVMANALRLAEKSPSWSSY